MLTIENATLVTPTAVIRSGVLHVAADGRIASLGPAAGALRTDGERFDAQGMVVAPGLIDIHVHGGHGLAFGTPETLAEDLRAYSAWVVSTGVTGFLCSVAAPDAPALTRMVAAYAALLDAGGFPGAVPLGLHLEGPFLNPGKRGAFNAAWLRGPSVAEARAFLDAGRGWVRQVTLSPELPEAPAVAALLRRAGVVAALGHSEAGYDTAAEALRGDYTHVTHTFNAQRGLHHREPGVVGAVLTSERVTAELIADGIHVHPGATRVLLRCLGPDRITLISDAMQAAGLGDGVFTLVGQTVTVRNGEAQLADGTIAGSTATMNHCVRMMHRTVGATLADAVKMASLTPARAMGLTEAAGSLAAGQPASLVVFDDNFDVRLSLVHGRRVV